MKKNVNEKYLRSEVFSSFQLSKIFQSKLLKRGTRLVLKWWIQAIKKLIFELQIISLWIKLQSSQKLVIKKNIENSKKSKNWILRTQMHLKKLKKGKDLYLDRKYFLKNLKRRLNNMDRHMLQSSMMLLENQIIGMNKTLQHLNYIAIKVDSPVLELEFNEDLYPQAKEEIQGMEEGQASIQPNLCSVV